MSKVDKESNEYITNEQAISPARPDAPVNSSPVLPGSMKFTTHWYFFEGQWYELWEIEWVQDGERIRSHSAPE